MRNIKLFGIALMGAAIFASCEPINPYREVEVADFEDVTVGAEVDSLNVDTTDGVYAFVSGEFGFSTATAYDGTYFYNYVVTNEKSNAFVDFNDQYHSACGGAYEGENFAVAYQDEWTEGASLSIDCPGLILPIAGTYVCNTAYVVNSILNGDAIAKKFEDGDWFLLTFEGYYADQKIGTVEFYLADYRNGKKELVTDWTYVDLTALGIVDEVRCKLTSSDNNDYGMNTPAYFCLDNFGAEK